MPLVDDLARDVREPLVEGGVGEDGMTRHKLDEHAVRGVILREECQRAARRKVVLVGGVQEGVAPYLGAKFVNLFQKTNPTSDTSLLVTRIGVTSNASTKS